MRPTRPHRQHLRKSPWRVARMCQMGRSRFKLEPMSRWRRSRSMWAASPAGIRILGARSSSSNRARPQFLHRGAMGVRSPRTARGRPLSSDHGSWTKSSTWARSLMCYSLRFRVYLRGHPQESTRRTPALPGSVTVLSPRGVSTVGTPQRYL